jgi:hypothetical protein
MTALGDHAIAELTAVGAPDVIKTPLITIVGTFADVPSPETNWPVMRDYLTKLLMFGPLTSITATPTEWSDQFILLGNVAIWQNLRWPDAWTRDPAFASYFLLSEITAGQPPTMYNTAPAIP